MRLNLGCGRDIKPGYINVDLRPIPGVDQVCDLLQLPWPFADESCDEVLMLDFFEHVPYTQNGAVLDEVWRVLRPGATVDIQVPDLDHSMNVIQARFPFVCNNCEREIRFFATKHERVIEYCPLCGHSWDKMVFMALKRLYGGQDYPGNFHYFAFNRRTLTEMLESHGFGSVQLLEEEHQYRQWSLKVRATRKKDVW